MKWKGYGPDHNSYEPAENFDDGPMLKVGCKVFNNLFHFVVFEFFFHILNFPTAMLSCLHVALN